MRRRPRSRASLVVLILVLLLCMWLMYKLFIGIPKAPAPTVKMAALRPRVVAAVAQSDGFVYSHHLRVSSTSCLA